MISKSKKWILFLPYLYLIMVIILPIILMTLTQNSKINILEKGGIDYVEIFNNSLDLIAAIGSIVLFVCTLIFSLLYIKNNWRNSRIKVINTLAWIIIYLLITLLLFGFYLFIFSPMCGSCSASLPINTF